MRKNSVLARFLIIGLMLMFLSYQWGDVVINGLIPIYQLQISQLAGHFDITFLGVVELHGEKFLQLNVLFSEPILINNDYFVPQSPIPNVVRMPLGNVLLPIVLALTIIFSWPAIIISEYCYRCFIVMPLILMVMLMDIPMQFIYMLWDGVYHYINPNKPFVGWLLYWSDFLNGGGLIALSLAAGLLAVGAAVSIAKER